MEAAAVASPVAQKAYAESTSGHVSLGRSLRVILFVLPVLVMGLVLYGKYGFESPGPIVTEIVFAIFVGIIVSGVRVAAQWERGVLLRLGRFRTLKGPGIMYIIPFIEYIRFVDTRVLAINIPSQKVITKDNVPAQIDSVLFFLVADTEKAILKVQDFRFAIAQYAQASLRDVVGGLSLDELLSERERIQQQIGKMVEERIKDWGMHVDSVRLQDIHLPEDLQRMMSRQASAEREKRATITKAEGDKLAATNLAEAAATMQKSIGAMQLRVLQSIDGLGPSPSNTVVLYPVELTETFKALTEKLAAKG
jgi:regulator of protease activity HflC (stomatin/prohibitin superfamily)